MLFELGSPDFDSNRPIRLEFMEEACRLVDTYFMQSAKAAYEIVGANAEKNVIDRIIAYLKNRNGKATAKRIMADIKIKKKDFQEYLDTMTEAEIVKTEMVRTGKAGRPSQYVFLLDQSETAISNNFVDLVNKVAKVDNVDIVAKIHSDFNEEIAATKSTKSTIPSKSTNSTNLLGDESGSDQQKITLESNLADALPPISCYETVSNVDEKVIDKEDSIQNGVIVRFKTDYESDWHGIMRKFKEDEILEIPGERAETWIKRGIVEEVSEQLPSDEPL